MDTETETLINGKRLKPNQGLPSNSADGAIIYDSSHFQLRSRDRHVSYGSINGVRSRKFFSRCFTYVKAFYREFLY